MFQFDDVIMDMHAQPMDAMLKRPIYLPDVFVVSFFKTVNLTVELSSDLRRHGDHVTSH